ncbi:hypothetical protein [Streptomyces sp. NPDC090021]|uniref:hypothetical protein n=1 Tax=Streptomyces sp. NPDC090021 TaxID=3365919 RepID=UPI00381EE4E7
MNDEAVFIRHARTRQYVYNSRNPVGRALIVIAPIVATGVLYSLYSSWHWSEGELRTAVYQAAGTLNAKPHYASRATSQEDLVRNAVLDTGTGPGHGLSVQGNGVAGYRISTENTGTVFCMRLILTPVASGAPFPAALERHHVIATVTEGSC